MSYGPVLLLQVAFLVKNTIASKVTDKQVVSKEPVNKPVNQSMEKILAEKQKKYEEAKAKK